MTDLGPIQADARQLVDRCKGGGLRITTAESCTGGLVAAAITEISGASEVFDRGYVTYSNLAKTELLGVPATTIEQHGAVSEEVAVAMAEGALERSRSDLAVAVTGIAGPDGGTAEKPVGLVHIVAARRGHPIRHAVHAFANLGRESIRASATQQAIRMLMQQATG
jgi:nicotinamide-nucleotide amidase